jgi:hypothetical protein
MIYVNALPSDYRWATEYEAEAGLDNLIDPIYVRAPFAQVDIAVPKSQPMPCVREFGEHPCTGDDNCHAMEVLYNMTAPMPDDYLSYDYPAYDPGYEHYERFGRPAFPNEY